MAKSVLPAVFEDAKRRIPEKVSKPDPGGYLSVWYHKYGMIDIPPKLIGLSPIGNVSLDSRSSEFTQEKARRLASNRFHVSSWESREPQNQKYGGAIRVGDLILSFSGIPEEGDEMLCLTIASFYGWIGGKEIDEILEKSSNRLAWVFNKPKATRA